MKKEVEKAATTAREEALRLIDDASLPEKMTKAEALEYIEDVISSLETRADCLRDEMKEEDDG